MTTIEALANEVQQLEQALKDPDLDRTAEMAVRERHAFASRRLADLETSAPYEGVSTEDLQAQREAGEIERETARLELEAVVAQRGEQSKLAQKMKRDLHEMTERNVAVRAELDNRVLAEANALGFKHNAERRAEREIREQDEAAIAELEDWARPMASHKLAESFDKRVAKHAEALETQAWQDAEKKIGARIVYGVGGQPTELPTEEQEIEE